MSKAILILHRSNEAGSQLAAKYASRGNLVREANSLERAERVLESFRPAIVVLDPSLLTVGWETRAPQLASTRGTSEWVRAEPSVPSRGDEKADRSSGGPNRRRHSNGRGSPDRAAGGRSRRSRRRSKPNVQYPLRLKITVPYAILAVVIALSGAYIVTRLVFDTIEERFTNQLIEAGKISAEWMVGLEQEHLESLRLVQHTDGLVEAVETGDAERIRALVLPLAVNEGLDMVAVIDSSGEALLSLRHVADGAPESYEANRGDASFGDLPSVQRALSGVRDDQGDKWAGMASTPGGSYGFFSGPLRSAAGDPIGAVVVGSTLESLANGLRATTGGQATLYLKHGEPVASTLLEAAFPLDPTLADRLLAGQDSQSLQREFTAANIEYREILGPMEVRNGTDLGIVGTALPRNFLVQASFVTRVQVFGFVSVAFLLVIAVGLVISGRMTRPLMELVRASVRVARGDLTARVPEGGNDEVSYLSSSFNEMVRALQQSNEELQEAYAQTLEAYEKTIEGWSKALELRDEETEGHTKRVTEMTVELARRMGVPESDIPDIRRGALLHDIGKMAVPDSILNKPGKLTDDEWRVMRKHPEHALEMLAPIKYLERSLTIPYYHHERWDGTGYPEGLEGESIPLAARIFAVVDVWDALTSDRPYRRAWPLAKVIKHIENGKGTHFDPEVTEAFLELQRSRRVREAQGGAASQTGAEGAVTPSLGR